MMQTSMCICAVSSASLCLTHLCRMDFPISINSMGSFPILGLLGGIFPSHSNFNRTFCKQTVETLIRRPHYVASDLGLHCLLMSHKNDAGLIWVNWYFNFNSSVQIPLVLYLNPSN